MLFILGCALFLCPLHSKIALCGDRFLLRLAGFFLWPLPICFWMLRAVSGSSSSQRHLFPCEESDLQRARLAFEDKNKKCLRRQKRATKFVIAAASISKQWLIIEVEYTACFGEWRDAWKSWHLHPGSMLGSMLRKITSSALFSHYDTLNSYFFSYSYFFQNIKAILKRQEVRSGSQVSKKQRKKNDLATF